MSYYSLHFVSPTMGYFEREESFDAVNDEVAIGIAQRRAVDQPVELWCGGRLVRRFDTAEVAQEAASSAPKVAA
ncbi:hypothetical protein [Sphingosinicella terrae]|jgi:hypothetical protein|uniref:hypothetical protein n=1 Tax=Sphingosinicella terrae TaxID=2172047 RepID=UPI000E0D66BB|nr:hypothetical protein [Sphingosinicella terrae]